MINRTRASLLAVLACAAFSSCGGGGTTTAGAGGAPVAPSPPGSPPSPPPPPPPPSGPTGDVRPALFIEKDAAGAAYLRVEEQAYTPFAAQRTVADQLMGPAPGQNYVVEGEASTAIKNIDAVRMKHGLTMQASGEVEIYDYTYTQFDGGGSIHGAAMKLGDNGRPTNGSTYIQRVTADGMQTPDATYKISNNDFLGVETDSGPIYVRDVSGKNFGDAGVDTKSTQVYIMNATLEHSHRMLRAWPGVEIIVVNSIINGTAGHSQGWVYDGTSTIRYYNTLWCMDAANPGPNDPNCRMTPWAVEGEEIATTVALARFIPLAENPLPGISPFFKTGIDQISAEYSRDGGSTWQALTLPNSGGPGSAPIGDPRYKIPLNLADANYLFRASYMKNSAKVGATSVVIDEAGTAQ